MTAAWGLAGDQRLVEGIEAKTDGRAIFVEDVAATRLALVVVGGQLAVVTGPRGSAGGDLSTVMSVPLSEAGCRAHRPSRSTAR